MGKPVINPALTVALAATAGVAVGVGAGYLLGLLTAPKTGLMLRAELAARYRAARAEAETKATEVAEDAKRKLKK